PTTSSERVSSSTRSRRIGSSAVPTTKRPKSWPHSTSNRATPRRCKSYTAFRSWPEPSTPALSASVAPVQAGGGDPQDDEADGGGEAEDDAHGRAPRQVHGVLPSRLIRHTNNIFSADRSSHVDRPH